MSAVEKLRELGVWVDRGGDSGPYDVCEREQAETLLDVLPQIVAVVEELGFAISDLQSLLDSDALTKTGRKKLENHIELHRAALVALDEALSSDEGIHNAFDANQWD